MNSTGNYAETERYTENYADVIAGLIQTCRDAQLGFLNAAEYVRNSDLRAYFIGQSMERARFAAELRRVAQQLGEPELSRGAPMANRIQRAWINLKFARRSDGAVLSGVAEAIRTTKDYYRRALSMDLLPYVQAVLERQAEEISDSYDQICTLRDMRGKAA